MTQLKQVVDPFGEVNVYSAASGHNRVVATILMTPYKEGAQTGIALDGSGSMSKLYGLDDGSRVLSPVFGGPKKLENNVRPVAQRVCAYLARKIDADGGTTCIYWAVGMGGGDVQVVGDFTADQAENHAFDPPSELGTGTMLLPAVRYFVERFRDAPWGFYVFVSDGELHDLDEVKSYSVNLAREIAAGRRNPVKLVLIGLGEHVNEVQMHELDDLDAGVDVDLWDHKLAAEMRVLEEIFAEVVDKNARVADHGRILDSNGNVVKDYSSTGMPAYLEFEIDSNATHFVLEVNGNKITQSLRDSSASAVSETVSPSSTPAASGPTTTPVSSVLAGEKEAVEEPELIDDAAEVVEPKEDEDRGEWGDLPLEFENNLGGNDDDGIDLEKQED